MPWGIYHNYHDIDGSHRPYLLGYGYFGWIRPEHLSGYKIATFATRKLARTEAKKMGKKYRAVHVTVKVTADI